MRWIHDNGTGQGNKLKDLDQSEDNFSPKNPPTNLTKVDL